MIMAPTLMLQKNILARYLRTCRSKKKKEEVLREGWHVHQRTAADKA